MLFRQILFFILVTIASAAAVPEEAPGSIIENICPPVGKVRWCIEFNTEGTACATFVAREPTPCLVLSSALTRTASSRQSGEMPLQIPSSLLYREQAFPTE